MSMSNSQEWILEILQTNYRVGTNQLSAWTGYAQSTVRRVIQELRRIGHRIESDGDSHNEGSYRLY